MSIGRPKVVSTFGADALDARQPDRGTFDCVLPLT
jgi:hypothetical protein